MTSVAAVEVRDLVKSYPARWGTPQRTALDRVDLVVEAGQGVALVGPNGAGKSTLLWLLSGLRHPTSGTVRIGGEDPRIPQVRARIGLLPDRPALYPELTAIEHLRLAAGAWNLHDPEPRIADVMGRLGLGAASRTPARALSAGLQRRVALALALLPAPAVLLLDEPLSALDPESVRIVCEALSEERARGAALVIATHRLAQLVGCCDRVVQVVAGTVERLGDTEAVLVKLPVRVVFTLPPGAAEPTAGSPEVAPPGVWIRVVPAPRREVLIDQVRAAGGAVLRVAPMLELLTLGSADAEETLL